mmetsp:Transcript_15598/g.24258  ORF Transcript_15598/g.24258 Transcript_15598/m.24258 type:complete len:89 (+) Transcript_15598:874-1140(+)
MAFSKWSGFRRSGARECLAGSRIRVTHVWARGDKVRDLLVKSLAMQEHCTRLLLEQDEGSNKKLARFLKGGNSVMDGILDSNRSRSFQ